MYYIPVPEVITSDQLTDLRPLIDDSLSQVEPSEGLNGVMRKFVMLMDWNCDRKPAFLPEYEAVMGRVATGLGLADDEWHESFSWLFSFIGPNELPLHLDTMKINYEGCVPFRVPVLIERPTTGAVSQIITSAGPVVVEQKVGDGYGFRADLIPHGFSRFESGLRTAFGFGFEIKQEAYTRMCERFGLQE